MWNMFAPFSNVSIIDFEQVNVSWELNRTNVITNLIHQWLMFPSYRNQSADLLCKYIVWFLYDGNIVR